MFKKLLPILFSVFLSFSLIKAENYAVLITGAMPFNPDSFYIQTWNGGLMDPDSIYDEFWNDTFLMWEMLWQYGWQDTSIYVLYGNGDDTYWQWDRYHGNRYNYYPWNIAQVTDDSAYYQDVIDVFAHLDSVMTDDDFLFVWTFDHGDTINTQGDVLLALMDTTISDSEFAEIMPENYDKRVFWMQQCYAGGFIDNLANNSTVVLTAVDSISIAYGIDNTAPDFTDQTEAEPNPSDPTDIYTHGEFNYHVLNAARQVTVGYFNASDSVDLNSDGFTSIKEIKVWEFDKDTQGEPRFSDPGEIADSIFLNIPPYPPDSLELEDVNNQVHLTWVRNAEYDLMRYRIYRLMVKSDSSSNQYILIDSVGANTLEYTDPDFDPGGGDDGAAYYLTAVDSAYQKSATSDTVMSHGDIIEGQGGASAVSLIAGDYGLIVNPNPFNPATTIRFDLPQAGKVKLVVYDILGREAAVIANGFYPAGYHSAVFDGTDLASGIYFARLQAGDFVKTQKLLLIK